MDHPTGPMASPALVAGGSANLSLNAIDSPAEARSPPVCNPDPSGPNRSSSSSYTGGGGGVGSSGVADPTRHHPGPGSTGTGTNTGSPFSPSETVIKGEGRRPRSTSHDSVDISAAAAKKRRTGPGARGVANLTPDQLARKRANDREAQRAIRERHRLKTEQYEHEIRELKSKQPYQELQAVVRQKEAVEAELADVKRCMAAIAAMVQPILARPAGGAGAVDPSPPSPPGQSHHSHPPSQPPLAPLPTDSTPTSATSPASAGTHGRWQHSLSPVVAPVSVDGPPSYKHEERLLGQQRYDLAHSLDMGHERLGLDFVLDPTQKIARIQSGINGAQDSPQYRHVPMKHDSPATQTQAPLYSQPSISTSIPSASFPYNPNSIDTPCTTPLPLTSAPTCILDSVLLNFLAERRQRIAEGLSQTEILGPRYPSVSSLLNPAVSVYSHPLSKVFTDILERFPSLRNLPERVAILYLMFVNMRWMVYPTHDNLARVPAWLRPLRIQTDKAHAAWLDFVPFPRLRETVIRDYEPGEFSFDEFFVPYTETVSINWPYEDAFVLLASPTGDELMINPVFEQHLGVLDNWTIGEAFNRAFPRLKGTYNLKN